MKISPGFEMVRAWNSRPINPLGRLRGFSIIELLSVMAIMSLVTTLTLLSTAGSPWKRIESGAGVLGSHIDLARQQAIVNGCLTALVIPTEGSGAFQSFTILIRRPSGWSQLTPWKKLPEGVILKNGEEAEVASFSDAGYAGMEMPVIQQAGESLQPGTGYQAYFFFANGQTRGDTPSKLRVSWKADESTENGNPRYLDVVLIPSSGKVKYTSR